VSGPLTIGRDGAAWTFTLARADKRNALSAELVEALIAGIDDAHRADAELLVFRGDGKNFSAGFDFTDVETHSEGDLLLRFVRIETLLQAVWTSPCLTIGVAHGRNFGAGVDLFAACHRRVCTPDATFRMPGLKFGLVLGTRRFADLVGPTRAGAILQDARTFDATEALTIGFVDTIVETSRWSDTIEVMRGSAGALDLSTRSTLYDALRPDHGDADLAALTRSAARPGLKARIAHYLAAP
jgi:enoyl-CoA hydratase